MSIEERHRRVSLKDTIEYIIQTYSFLLGYVILIYYLCHQNKVIFFIVFTMTLPTRSASLRFAGSVFRERRGWIGGVSLFLELLFFRVRLSNNIITSSYRGKAQGHPRKPLKTTISWLVEPSYPNERKPWNAHENTHRKDIHYL